MKLCMLALVLALSGCANLKFQFSMSYATDSVLEDLKKAEAKK